MAATEVTETLKVDFRAMAPGQESEVSALVRRTSCDSEKGGGGPGIADDSARAALERYSSPTALEGRAKLGYACELAYVSGVLAGMIEMKGPGHVSMLYIHPDYANRGIGSRLIARAASRCATSAPKVKYLTVHATDDAMDFYERLGFIRNGSRRAVGGVFSTPCRLALGGQNSVLSSKLHGSSVELFVFSGTGNSLQVAQVVAGVLMEEGTTVRLHSMDKPCPEVLSEESAIGLAFPVACFSTYPTVWRFIESMPAGEGREVFMLGTCGGAPGGMQGPLRRVLTKKGYRPFAARFFVMPGNYNNKTLPVARNDARVKKALLEARFFACDLLRGRTRWSGGIPLLSALMYRLGQTRKPWDFFYRMFPISVNPEKCVRCGRCADNCPAGAITMPDGLPVVNASLCESCQRCVGFCPAGALGVSGKPAEPYRAMAYEEFQAAPK
ncbi:MAG: EFR1 family ferrodoxin [Synergistaceae bacterium]|nr:EFR1 family ferrodoxin [Synergistaceae bacterium]